MKSPSVPKRQHFLPQFLLRQFSDQAKEPRVWTYSKDRPQAHQRVNEVGHQRYFYGKDGITESKLGELESIHSAVINDVLNGRDPNTEKSSLASLIYCLGVRSRQLRECWLSISYQFADDMFSEGRREDFSNYLERMVGRHEIDELMDLIKDLPVNQRLALRIILTTSPDALSNLRSVLLSHLQQSLNLGVLDFAKEALDKSYEKIKVQLKEKHSKALASIASQTPDVWLSDAHYEVIDCSSCRQILGDSGVVAFSDSNEQIHPASDWKGCLEVALPLTPSACLSVRREGQVETHITATSLPDLVAAASFEFFVSDQNCDEHVSRVTLIGEKTFGSQVDINQILNDSFAT